MLLAFRPHTVAESRRSLPTTQVRSNMEVSCEFNKPSVKHSIGGIMPGMFDDDIKFTFEAEMGYHRSSRNREDAC